MKNLKHLLALVLALVMVAGLLTACGGNETPQPGNDDPVSENGDEQQGGSAAASDWNGEPVYGGHMNVHVYTKPERLDASKAGGTWIIPWASCIWENPLTRDADHNIAPGVCDFELSEDQLTLKLWVRENAFFNNGDPVDIYDVEASIARHTKGYAAAATKYVGKYIQSMSVDDAGKVLTIQFKSYNEKTMYYMASYKPWLGVMPKEICEKYAGDLITDQIEDCIGTGPYKVVDFENGVQVTVARNDHYVPIEGDYTGFAAPKMAYLDSITFWYNPDNSSATLALLNGDYDLTDVVDSEYDEMAEAAGIVRDATPSIMGVGIFFNTKNNTTPTGKYPSLRKAIMAAIDYDEYLEVVTDGCHTLGGSLAILDEYDTDAWENKEWFGETDQDVVDKYLEMAYAEGYNDEPVEVVYHANRDDITTLIAGYLDDAGINCVVNQMETSVFDSYIGDTGNNWDVYFTWPNYAYYPASLNDTIMTTYYKSAEKDALLAKLEAAVVGTEEYKALWLELAEVMAEDCAFGHMGITDWLWYHPATLHTDFEGTFPYVYNCFWEDPENHPSDYAA